MSDDIKERSNNAAKEIAQMMEANEGTSPYRTIVKIIDICKKHRVSSWKFLEWVSR